MYTQCPKCETIFKLSADVLRAAGGQVRCGRCGEVFNALARLAEDAGAFLDNESALDLEERADSILESAAALKVAEAVAKDYEDFVPPGIEIAQLQVLDYWADEEGDSPRGDRRAPNTDGADQVDDAGHDDDAAHADDAGPTEDAGQTDNAVQTDNAGHDDDATADSDSDVVTGQHAIAPPAGDFESSAETGEFEAAADTSEPRAEDDAAARFDAAHAAEGDPSVADPRTGSIDFDADAADDPSLEFTLPPGELDRIFVESRPSNNRPSETPVPAGAPFPDVEATPGSEAEAFDAPALEAVAEHEAGAGGGTLPESYPHPESAALRDRRAARVTGFEVAESVRLEILRGLEPERGLAPRRGWEPELPALEAMHRLEPPARGRRYAWLAAVIALALLLGVQVAYRHANWLAAHSHGPMGELVRALSGAMGTTLPAPANLTGYQVRQWGVTGDPGAAGTLRVRASILNAAAQLQPYPLLRVTLADRFGKRIGSRDFLPAEYLGKPVAQLLAPGERADAVLDILDPGKSAEGFEVDVCLRGAQRTQCANDAASQVKP